MTFALPKLRLVTFRGRAVFQLKLRSYFCSVQLPDAECLPDIRNTNTTWYKSLNRPVRCFCGYFLKTVERPFASFRPSFY